MLVDVKIIEGCIAGNRKSQKALFEIFKSSMLGVCLRYCKDNYEAEDVLMMAFVKVFGEIHTYRNEGNIEGWIRRIVINTAINNYKKNLKHYYHADIEEVTENRSEDSEPFELPDYSSVEDVLQAISQLPEGYKMVLNLYIVEGYKHKDIAEMLGIDVGTSKSQLSRARKMIQQTIINRGKA